MGATSSKVYVTDWDKADGHLHHDETVDKSSPFRKHETLHLSPSRKVHASGQRDFQVINEAGDTLYYTTKAVPNTAFWFDLLKNDEPMVQVRGHPWGKEWDIYAYHAPSYSGQEPDAASAALYLKARVLLNWTKDNAKVQLCHKKKKDSKQEWSDPVLVYDDINFLMGKGQTHLPSNTNLVSYSENLTTAAGNKHLIRLELAKGCDVALHVILTVIANVVHSNTNPFIAHANNSYSQDGMA
eukprot:CAMPEP_0119005612 /NCGR_PEP_ID=MMETSP1176-20130426/1830_1 /TAXON_ID=265551 /ORGANISM="Synedropsis recta cf, Strain CCMP1620" /LENGTH=240 /DNA_ID=CAMNT_0006957445 /DNA_START=75 /DNA_END=797 /DNA_ORIENTATION=-